MTTFGEDKVQRKSRLEQANIYSKKDYDLLWQRKFREKAPAAIPNADRQWVSQLGGIAAPQGRK